MTPNILVHPCANTYNIGCIGTDIKMVLSGHIEHFFMQDVQNTDASMRNNPVSSSASVSNSSESADCEYEMTSDILTSYLVIPKQNSFPRVKSPRPFNKLFHGSMSRIVPISPEIETEIEEPEEIMKDDFLTDSINTPISKPSTSSPKRADSDLTLLSSATTRRTSSLPKDNTEQLQTEDTEILETQPHKQASSRSVASNCSDQRNFYFRVKRAYKYYTKNESKMVRLLNGFHINYTERKIFNARKEMIRIFEIQLTKAIHMSIEPSDHKEELCIIQLKKSPQWTPLRSYQWNTLRDMIDEDLEFLCSTEDEFVAHYDRCVKSAHMSSLTFQCAACCLMICGV